MSLQSHQPRKNVSKYIILKKSWKKKHFTCWFYFLARKDRFNENKLKAIEDWRPEPVKDEYNFMWKKIK